MLDHILVAILVQVRQFNLKCPIRQSFIAVNVAKQFVFEQKFQQHIIPSIIPVHNMYLTSYQNCCTIENINIPMQMDSK